MFIRLVYAAQRNLIKEFFLAEIHVKIIIETSRGCELGNFPFTKRFVSLRYFHCMFIFISICKNEIWTNGNEPHNKMRRKKKKWNENIVRPVSIIECLNVEHRIRKIELTSIE